MNININDGGPAFPRKTDIERATDGTWETVLGYKGMSLRDYFAAAAFQAIISKTPLIDQQGEFGKSVQDKIQYNSDIAESAYWMADAMIVARDCGLKDNNKDLLEALDWIANTPDAWVEHELPDGGKAYEWKYTEHFLDIARSAVSNFKNKSI